MDCWGSSLRITCILSPALTIGALGLGPSLIGRPGAKLLLGPKFFFLMRRKCSLSGWYMAPRQPHWHMCPLPSPQRDNGVFACRGVYAVHPPVSVIRRNLLAMRQAHTRDDDLVASLLLSE